MTMIGLLSSCESMKETDPNEKFKDIIGDFGGTYQQWTSFDPGSDCQSNGKHLSSISLFDEFITIDVRTINEEDVEKYLKSFTPGRVYVGQPEGIKN